jgi:hypothetical protein
MNNYNFNNTYLLLIKYKAILIILGMNKYISFICNYINIFHIKYYLFILAKLLLIANYNMYYPINQKIIK